MEKILKKVFLKNNFSLGLILAAVFLLIGIFTLSDYGVNSDEHAHFSKGQAFLRYLLTGKKDYSGLPPEHSHKGLGYGDEGGQQSGRRSLYQVRTQDMNWLLEKSPSGHPGSNDLLAAVANMIFFQKLKVLGDIEAHHMFSLSTSAFLVFLVFAFAQEAYGGIAGLIAALALATYPLFLGESRFNVKDPPEAFFYAATLFCFWKGVKERKAKYFLLSAFFFGWGMGTKFNIFFLALALLPWLLILFWKNVCHLSWQVPKRITLALIAFPFIVGFIFFVTNPTLWRDPVGEFLRIFNYYRNIGGFTGARSTQPGFLWRNFNFYPILTAFYTTPLITLFFSAIGVLMALFSWKKEKQKTSLLILFWFIVPILRVTLPPTSIYGGLRQIMEYIPAMAVLAGLGAETLRQFLAKKIYLHQRLIVFLFILSFLPITVKMVKIHPNQNIYFNPLIGGLAGAAKKDYPYYGTDMGNVYLQGVKWLNENAEKNAKLALPIGNITNLPWIKLREDISFANTYASLFFRQGEYVMDTFYQGKIQNYRSWYYRRFVSPVHEVKIEGVPILKIWKNDLKYTRPWLVNTKKMKPKLIWKKEAKEAIFDFEKIFILERLSLEFAPSCKIVLEDKGRKIYYSIDGNHWHIEAHNDWTFHKWASRFYSGIAKEVLEEKDLVFPLAGRKARFLKIELPTECLGKIDDWEAQFFLDFINLSVSLERNQLVFSADIIQPGEYYLISSGGKFNPKIKIRGKEYLLWFDTLFIQKPIFEEKDEFFQTVAFIQLEKSNFSFSIPIKTEDNLLRNPSFENELKHWSGGEIVSGGTSGDKALLLKQAGKGKSFVYQQTIPNFEQSAVYFVSFDYKLLQGEAAVGIWQPPYPDYPQKPERLTEPKKQWQDKSFLLRSAENTQSFDFYLYVISDDEKGAEVLFDNFFIQKLSQDALPREVWLIKKSD